MGAQRILQATRAVALGALALALALTTSASAAPRLHERVAVIDLGPPGADADAARKQLATTIIAAGLDVVIGDGVEDALAGQTQDRDVVPLAAALAEAQRAFGALDCAATTTASRTAIGIAAARQAAGLPVPELPRAWTYVLLCADRAGDVDAAMRAAKALRVLGGGAAPADVPAGVWTKYPDVDAAIDREMVPLDITADVAGAEIWIDFQRAGSSPLHVPVTAGDHVIAAAAGTRRGWAAGAAVRTQTALAIPTTEQRGPHGALAQRVAGWHGRVPSPTELAAVFGMIKARVAVIRYGDTIEAWGRIGPSEQPRRLGGEDGVGTLAERERVVALIADRVQTWNDRAPDPDQPLLVETPRERLLRSGKADEPTRWWVYAAIVGAVAAAGIAVYAHDSATDTQHVELHWP